MTATIAEPVTFEYRSFAVNPARASLARDTYASFGWFPDAPGTSVTPSLQVTLNMKRDRHIKNRPVIAELQRRAETALAAVDKLERRMTTKAMAVALTVGLVGAGLLAGSVFTFMAAIWAPFVILGVLGLACWVVPFFAYKAIRATTTATLTPLVNEQYDTIYDACEQAQQLLS